MISKLDFNWNVAILSDFLIYYNVGPIATLSSQLGLTNA